jgi:type II secretory pathway component GspD/PulD (secretin)
VSISSFVGDSTDPALPPPRQENRVQSVVTVPDGYTVVVGGLDIETQTEATSQVPLAGDVPLLGALFRSRSVTHERRRFFVFLRASVLRGEGFEELRWVSEEPLRAAA